MGGIETHDNEVAAEEPASVLWSLHRLCSDESALRAYFSYLHPTAIRDALDWRDFKVNHLTPFLTSFAEAFGAVYKQALWEAAVLAGRAYRCDISRFDPSDIYTRAGEFYHSCGIGRSVTFSTSSGLPNPMERHGTDWFIDRYSLDQDDPVTKNLILKNPFRTQNFTEGCLNASFQCERQYVWEQRGTARALQQSYTALPTDKRDLFIADAVGLLAECYCPRLRIVETDSFEGWMSRFTRCGPNSVMISFRGPKSKKISHAVNLTFAGAKKAHNFYQLAIGVTAAATSFPPLAGPAGSLAALCWSVVAVENYAYGKLESEVLRKGHEWGSTPAPGLRIVKEFGTLGDTATERRKLAECEIHRLLGLSIDKPCIA